MLLRKILSVAACSLLLPLCLHAADPATATAPKRQPNIIFILADDLGYGELGCYGQKVIQTPHLNRMAREGLRFTQFYAGATVCAPSRSVLMTGQHQGRTRVRGNTDTATTDRGALHPEDPSFVRMLQQAGYRTGMVGKWGLGEPTGPSAVGLPHKHGFDFFFGYLNHHHAHNHYPDHLWRNQDKIALPNPVTPVGEMGGSVTTDPILYADDLFADQALRFVAQNQDRPFFLYWALVTPHANNEAFKTHGDGNEVPDYGPYARTDWPAQDKGHAAMISRLDRDVGRMLGQLHQLGLAENTLVIFTSDNGPHREGGHHFERFQPSGPLSGHKRSLTDGGIRVPFIAWWPETIAANTTSNHVGYFGDWFATAAELTGFTAPAGLDSISFAPTLLGKHRAQKNHDYLYWEFHENGFSQAALYKGRWKAIRLGRADAPLAIYDLQKDLGETRDIAAENPKLVAQFDEYFRTARRDDPAWPTAR